LKTLTQKLYFQCEDTSTEYLDRQTNKQTRLNVLLRHNRIALQSKADHPSIRVCAFSPDVETSLLVCWSSTKVMESRSRSYEC